MVSVPLQWQISITGADHVKSTMAALQTAMDRGQISGRDMAHSMNMLARESRTYTNVGRSQSQLFLAMHPNVNKLSRGFSAFASVSRTALTITNSLNIALLRGTQVSAAQRELVGTIAELYRELNRAPADKKQGITEQISILEAQLKEMKNAELLGGITDIVGAIGGIGMAVSSAIQIMPKLITALKGMSVASMLAFGPIGIAIGAIVLALIGLDMLFKAIFGEDYLSEWADKGSKALVELFTVTIPTALSYVITTVTDFFKITIPMAIGQAAIAFSNFFLVDIPSWVMGGVNFIIGEFTKLKDFVLGIINSIVNAIKSIIFPSGGGTSGGTSGGASNAASYRATMQSPTKRATGFEGMVNTPQLMMVGDAGPEYVSVTPHGGTRSGGGSTTIIVNVAGSIITEKELYSKLDQMQKNNMKRHGFTGFQ